MHGLLLPGPESATQTLGCEGALLLVTFGISLFEHLSLQSNPCLVIDLSVLKVM